MFKTTLFTLSLVLASFAQASLNCPSLIELNAPHFLGGQEYPTFEQLRTNFNQSFQLPGRPDQKTWEEADLQAAHAFATVLKRHTVNHQIELSVHEENQVCVGSIETLNYQIDDARIVFNMNYRNTITIQKGVNVAAAFWLALPSNCSNCSSEASLFEFSNVAFR